MNLPYASLALGSPFQTSRTTSLWETDPVKLVFLNQNSTVDPLGPPKERLLDFKSESLYICSPSEILDYHHDLEARCGPPLTIIKLPVAVE